MSQKVKLNIFGIIQLLLMLNLVGGSANILSSTVLSIFYDIAVIMLAVLTVLDLIYKPMNKKTLILVSLLLILSIALSSISQRSDVFLMILLALAFRDVNFDEFLARDLIIRLLITAWIVIKFFKTSQVNADYLINERQDFGFGHPNSLGMMLTMIGIELMTITRKSKVHFLSYIVSIGLLAVNFYLCKSRTSLLILAAAIICFFLLAIKANLLKFRFFQFLSRNLFIILTILCFGLVYTYKSGSNLGLTLDTLFSSRLSLASHYLDLYKINLFGNNAIVSYVAYEYEGTLYYVVDMAYIFIPIIYGMVGTFVYAFLYNISLRQLFIKEKYHYAVLLILMLFYGIMETGFYKYQFNTFMILISYGLFAFEKEDEKCTINKYVLSAFISLFIFVVLFRKSIIQYGSLFYIEGNTDLYRQVQLMLGYYEKMQGLNFSLYDWTLGFGASFFSLVKEGLFSPFNLLVLLLKKEWIKYSLIWLNAIKICFLGVTSCMWISKITKNRSIILTSSIVITFSAIITMSWCAGFFDVYVFLPLVLYFVEIYIQKNKAIGFVFSLSLIFLCNCTYSILIAIFVAIYCLSREKHRIKIDFLLIDLAILGIVSFITIPTLQFFETSSSKTFGDSLISFFTSFNGCNSFGYVLALSLVIIFIDDKKKKIKYLIGFVLCLIISVVLQNKFGLYGIVIPYLYVIVILIESFSINGNSADNIYLGLILINDLLIIVDLFVNDNSEEVTIIKLGILMISMFACFTIKRNIANGISLLLVASSLFVTYNFSNQAISVSKIEIDSNTSTLTDIAKNDSGVYRIINDDGANNSVGKSTESYNLNYAYSDYGNQIPGVLINSDYYNNNMVDFLNLYTSSTNDDYMGYVKNEISFNSIVGTKYWYSTDSEKIPSSLYQKIDGTDYYINKYFIELGYINNKTINSSYLKELNTFEIEKVLREYVALDESDNTSYDLISNYNLTMLDDYTYDGYLEHDFEEPIDNVTLCINNGGMPVLDVEVYHTDGTVETTHFYQYDFCDVDIDQPTNKVVVKFEDIDNNGYGIRLYMCESNDNLEENLYNIRKVNAFYNVSLGSNTINAQIDASQDNSLVYTYVPYDTKWIVLVDGEEVQTMRANYGFISFRVNSGSHNVEFKYEVSSDKIIPICSLVVLAACLVVRKIWTTKN